MPDEYVTRQEIRDQPTAIDAVLSELDRCRPELEAVLPEQATVAAIGCGTSYYLASAGSALLAQTDRATATPAGEVLLGETTFSSAPPDVILPISRSGTSTETVRATIELAERHPDATVLGLTCTAGSPLDDAADLTIRSPEGAEESVVMTKSFSSMLLALEYLALLRRDSGPSPNSLQDVPRDSEAVVDAAADLASALAAERAYENYVFLGSGPLYGLASEAMLKMEEMTLSWSKAYHALEFRHGPRSIADEDTLVTLFVPGDGDSLYADLVDDARSQGSEVVAVGRPSGLDGIDADHELELPSGDAPGLALYAPFFQFLGYYTAVENGLDPDDPRHLSQVVEF